MAWLGPDINNTAAACALEFVSTLLTTGRTSRLVRQLREDKGWVRNINSYFSPQRDPGLFVIGAYLEPEHLDEVEAAVRQEIHALIADGPTAAEMERARRLLVSEFVFGTETPSQTCALYGYYGTVGKLEQVDIYRALLDTLTAENIQQCAQTYLTEPATLIFTPE
jgi:predicted Zn-dependent peptidase